jgi:hypothetical protein
MRDGKPPEVTDWVRLEAELARVARQQIFFVGGAPRSGTTWLQQLLDAHPDISCRGEGLFRAYLAEPIDALTKAWGEALQAKNARNFAHTGGYLLPDDATADLLLRTAIIHALMRQGEGRAVRAIGEKTPENVFFAGRLERLFPEAKFIAIARDPRDVIASAWHFFRKPDGAADTDAGKEEFIRLALPSIAHGGRVMLEQAARAPDRFAVITYEALHTGPVETMAGLYGFLGVSAAPEIVQASLARTDFATQTGGRPAGVAQDGAFLRQGIAGGWRRTLTAAMGAVIANELGWMFDHFRWPRGE